jgi:hypothetical protein
MFNVGVPVPYFEPNLSFKEIIPQTCEKTPFDDTVMYFLVASMLIKLINQSRVYRKPMIETVVSKEDTVKIPAEPPEGLIEMKEMKDMLDKYFANQVNSQG